MEKLITNFWKGEISLWRSYWLIGELLNALFILLIFNIEIYIFGNSKFTSSLPFLDFSCCLSCAYSCNQLGTSWSASANRRGVLENFFFSFLLKNVLKFHSTSK